MFRRTFCQTAILAAGRLAGANLTGTTWVSAAGYDAGKAPLRNAAERAAGALVKGQLVSGGWDYRIEFDPESRARFRYRVSPAGGENAANTSTLDDDVTQSALRFLMEYDRETGMKNRSGHKRDATVRISATLKITRDARKSDVPLEDHLSREKVPV